MCADRGEAGASHKCVARVLKKVSDPFYAYFSFHYFYPLERVITIKTYNLLRIFTHHL
jgi:hypothetical protein